ncbi:MAG: hypothetical protein ACOYLH_04620 [Flavobacteriales bacterium]
MKSNALAAMKWLTFVLMLILSADTSAQSEDYISEVKPSWVPNGLYITSGMNTLERYVSDFQTVNKLIDLNSMPGYRSDDVFGTNSTSFGGGAGLQVLLSQYSSMNVSSDLELNWRYGFYGGQGQLLQLNYFNEDKFAYDTLVSSNTDFQIKVDSVFSRSWNVQTNFRYLGLKGELIAKIKTQRAFQLYVGLGLGVHAITNMKTDYDYTEYSYFENRSGEFLSEYNEENLNENVHFSFSESNGGGVGTSLYSPIGFTLRLGNKREFWKRLHYNLEFAPALGYSYLRDLGGFWNSGFLFQSGLRIDVR